jgi:diacylglycerol kinase family enzyme
MRFYINPHCDFGYGWKKWLRIEPALQRRYGNFEAEKIQSLESIEAQVQRAFEEGEDFFVAAGGDGTVHLLLNALLNLNSSKQKIIFGAVGLGSSNDFHKPFCAESYIDGIPVRLNRDNQIYSDVISVEHRNGNGRPVTSYCLVNASVGITAEANALYNSRVPLIVRIKRFSHEAAVIAAALITIFRYKNIACRLTLDNKSSQEFNLTNLGVVKNPHFAGNLCYDTHVSPDDGNLGVNLCSDMAKLEAVRALVRLYKRKFNGYPKIYSWLAKELFLESERPIALEMDGEVIQASQVRFKILPKRLRCCR